MSDGARRTLDACVAIFALAALSPLLLLIAFVVWLDIGKPILFRQTRVGRNSVEFVIFKFRTMRVQRGCDAGSFKPGDTSGITRTGRRLRSCKLDELPQLWNVMMGDMSLVGPRPEVRQWVDAYPQSWSAVHAIRPGLTDPAGLVFWHEETILASVDDPGGFYENVALPTKLQIYRRYLDTRSFRGDLTILLRTLWRVVGELWRQLRS